MSFGILTTVLPMARVFERRVERVYFGPLMTSATR